MICNRFVKGVSDLLKETRDIPKVIFFVTLIVLLAACGGGTSQLPPDDSPDFPFQNARSESCADTRGAEALYWDFMNGVIRADYPDTIRLIPYAPGTHFFHPVQPLYSFIYPSDWEAVTLTDSTS